MEAVRGRIPSLVPDEETAYILLALPSEVPE